MRTYQVYKVKGDRSLEPMGGYEASTGQAAINKMAKRGILSGREWAMKYVAIPNGTHFKHLSPMLSKVIGQAVNSACPMTDEQRWQMEQHLQNEQWESNMSNLYTYGDDGFCDGFTNW